MKPTCSSQFCHRTTLPSTSKLGPSGWVISSGLMSSRRAPASAIAASTSKLPDSAGIGTTPWSSIRSTSRRVRSTSAIRPSTGCAHSLSPGRGWMKATHRASRPSSSLGSPKLPGGQASIWTASKSVTPRLASAAWNAGSRLTSSSASASSSTTASGWTPSSRRHSSRRGPSRAIVISCVLASARSSSTTSASRGSSGGRSPRSSRSIRSMSAAFAGLRSSIVMNRPPRSSSSYSADATTRPRTAEISSAVSGSSGWDVVIGVAG